MGHSGCRGEAGGPARGKSRETATGTQAHARARTHTCTAPQPCTCDNMPTSAHRLYIDRCFSKLTCKESTSRQSSTGSAADPSTLLPPMGTPRGDGAASPRASHRMGGSYLLLAGPQSFWYLPHGLGGHGSPPFDQSRVYSDPLPVSSLEGRASLKATHAWFL